MDEAEQDLTNLVTVNLLVATGADEDPFFESVLVRPVGGDRHVVHASPGMLAGLAAGDEIELAPDDPLGFRVLRRGGNVCVQFLRNGEMSECTPDLTARVGALGGWLDGETPGLLVFTIPVVAGFPAIERIFAERSSVILVAAGSMAMSTTPPIASPLCIGGSRGHPPSDD